MTVWHKAAGEMYTQLLGELCSPETMLLPPEDSREEAVPEIGKRAGQALLGRWNLSGALGK